MLVGIADGRGEGARAGLRFAEENEALGVAAVHAALRDDVIHRDIPVLRVDGFEARKLVGDPIARGFFASAARVRSKNPPP